MSCDPVCVVDVLEAAEPAFVEVITEASPAFVEVLVPGVPGPQGPGVQFDQIAAVPIGGHKVVRPVLGGVAPASASDIAQANTIIGITRGAVAAGALADIAFAGELEEPSWAWALGPVFVGENGALTQTAPSAGFVQRVGIAITPTKIAVLIGPATIKL